MASWWEKENIRFECQAGCFKCCLKPGVIFFEEGDILRASKFLNCTPSELKSSYLEFEEYEWLINVRADTSCPFLEKQGCSIHEAKPKQCSTYPFWRELLVSKIKWKLESENCPGIGVGPMITTKAIKEIF
ncbi:MAG: YkgJ family cysteine cluster protein [Nitrospinales bacterium]